MINNRQNGRRRGRGGGAPRPNGGGNGADRGSRLDNRARGNASQLHEKYKTLARDTQMQGDRVMTEYYLQFADHYFRVLSESRSRFEEQRRDRFDEQDDDGEEMDGDFDGIEQPFDDRQSESRQADNRQADNGRQRSFDRADRNERPREQQRDDRGYRDDRQPREARERDGNREAGNRDTGNRESGNRDTGNRDGVRDAGNRDGRERDNRDARPSREPRETRMSEPQRGDFAPDTQDQPAAELREQPAARRPRESAADAPVAERRPRGRPRREPIPPVVGDSDGGERIDIGVLPPSFTAATTMPVADVQPDPTPLDPAEEKPRRRLRRPRADEATVDA